MPSEQPPGKVAGLAASWQLLGSTVCSGGPDATAAGREGSGCLIRGRTDPLPGQELCTPAIGAAKTPAKGCPRPCVTTARPSLGLRIRAAGQNAPENQLELIHHSRECCGAQTAGQRLAEMPAWACRGRSAPSRSPTAGPLGRKGRGLRSGRTREREPEPRCERGPRPLLGLSARPRARAAPGAGQRRHLPSGGGDCAGPGPAAPPHSRARRARGTGWRQQRRSRDAAGAAGGVVPRTRAGNVHRWMERIAAVPPSKRPGGRLSSQAVAWPSGLRRWI